MFHTLTHSDSHTVFRFNQIVGGSSSRLALSTVAGLRVSHRWCELLCQRNCRSGTCCRGRSGQLGVGGGRHRRDRGFLGRQPIQKCSRRREKQLHLHAGRNCLSFAGGIVGDWRRTCDKLGVVGALLLSADSCFLASRASSADNRGLSQSQADRDGPASGTKIVQDVGSPFDRGYY